MVFATKAAGGVPALKTLKQRYEDPIVENLSCTRGKSELNQVISELNPISYPT